MIYLKKFDNENNYLAYRDGKKYGKPNVSLSVGSKAVHYNYPEIDTNGFDFVNLKLPSGTLWATCNVGASSPYDSGLYFQWGDASGYTASQVGTGDGKKAFAWKDYKWSIDGSDTKFSKYTAKGATLELEDDAAHVYMGGDWHTPSIEQIRELISSANTTSAWTASNGITGMTLTSKKDTTRTIYFPAVGSPWNGYVQDVGRNARVWGNKLDTGSVNNSYRLGLDSSGISLFAFYRCCGRSIRGVI